MSSTLTKASPTPRRDIAFEGDLIVHARRDETADVISLDLVAPDGRELPTWEPGAHIDLTLPSGLTRQYSLCGSPEDSTTWRIAILREPDGRGGSAWLHDNIVEGAELRVQGPRNHFRLVRADSYVFVAGGIGITPLLPMIAQAEAWNAEWVLHYLGRRRASMAFLSRMNRYGDRVRVTPRDEADRLDVEATLRACSSGTKVYSCGPADLLAAVEEACGDMPSCDVHVERFTAEPVPEGREDQPIEVELRNSDLTLTVPADQSILSAVQDAGIDVASSCEEGTCGSCETAVLEGEVDHRDCVLTSEEQAANDTMMICVSRSTCGRLVLDL